MFCSCRPLWLCEYTCFVVASLIMEDDSHETRLFAPLNTRTVPVGYIAPLWLCWRCVDVFSFQAHKLCAKALNTLSLCFVLINVFQRLFSFVNSRHMNKLRELHGIEILHSCMKLITWTHNNNMFCSLLACHQSCFRLYSVIWPRLLFSFFQLSSVNTISIDFYNFDIYINIKYFIFM